MTVYTSQQRRASFRILHGNPSFPGRRHALELPVLHPLPNVRLVPGDPSGQVISPCAATSGVLGHTSIHRGLSSCRCIGLAGIAWAATRAPVFRQTLQHRPFCYTGAWQPKFHELGWTSMTSDDLTIGESVGVRYAVEFRFKPKPLILDRGGALASEYWREPFVHWRVGYTPFRVELFNESRSKVVAATIRSLQVEMEAPETYTMFHDHLSNWLRLAMSAQFFGELDITRMGYRTWLFAPVADGTLDALSSRMSEQFSPGLEPLSQMDGWSVADQAHILDMSNDQKKIHMQIGPMGRDQAKEMQWVQTDDGEAELSDLSFAMDIDVSASWEQPAPHRVRDIMRFVDEAHELVDRVSLVLTCTLRGAQ